MGAQTDVQRIIINTMSSSKTKHTKPTSNKFPRLANIIAERAGFRPLESQEDVMAMARSMKQLEESIPASAKNTHKLMNAVAERMLLECSSGTDSAKIANAISAAAITYGVVRDIYAGTAKALKEARNSTETVSSKRSLMYERIVRDVRVPVSLSESSDMKTVFGTIFKEIGEMQLEDFERVANTLPDFDVFLPRNILDQVAKKKLEQSARQVSF